MPVALDPAGQLPTLTVEVDKTNQPTNPTRVWTEITSYVRQLQATTSGRNDEFQRTTPGTLNLLLNNRDDSPLRFETLGVAKAQWIRVSATWQGTTYRLWQGVIEQLLRQWPSSGKDATIQLVAADSLKICRLYDLAGTTFPAERVDQRVTSILGAIGFPVGYSNAVMGFSPSLYWRLGESAGTTANDSSLNGRNGTYGAACVLGQTGPLVGDSDTAVSFPNSATALVTSSYSAFAAGSKRTFMAWANQSAATDANAIISDNIFGNVALFMATSATEVRFVAQGASPTIWAGAVSGTGVWFHIALTYDDAAQTAELFINGISQGTRSVSAGYPGSPGTFTAGSSTQTWNGLLDEVAVFPAILTAAQIRTIYNAGLVAATGSFDTDTDNCDAVSTPLSLDSDALSQLLALEGSNNGLLIAKGDGTLAYQGRHWRLLNSQTSTGTFADDGSGIPYQDNAEYQDDDSRLANRVTVTPLTGSAITVQDATSQAKYFTRTNQTVDRGLLSSSAPLALSAAQYLLARYKDPTPRIPTLEVQLLGLLRYGTTYITKMLAAANSQRFTWKRTTASPVTKDVFIEQVTHTIDPQGPSWLVTLACTPADVETFWLLGITNYGELGVNTPLAY